MNQHLENIIEKVILYNFNYNILEIISKEKISDISTFSSNNTKDVDDIIINPVTHLTKSIYIFKLFHSASTKNIYRRNNLCNLEFSPIKDNKNYKSNNVNKNNVNIKENSFFNIKQIKKTNFTKNKFFRNKNKSNRKININNASKPVNTVSNHNKKINIHFKKVEKNKEKKDDLYTQNKSLTFMKEFPPKVPEFLNHDLNLENVNKTNTYGNLNKEKIPHVFYNHLMLSNDYNNDLSVKKRYLKASVTKRNQNKILTIVYYTPKL